MTKDEIEAERKRFESLHTIPNHCIWIGNEYAATEYNAWSANDYAQKWIGWISCAKDKENV